MTTQYIVRIVYPDSVCEQVLSADVAKAIYMHGRILLGPDNVSLIPAPPARQ
jgi:hypothetical protein